MSEPKWVCDIVITVLNHRQKYRFGPVVLSGSEEELQADAMLMAAAPELYEALKDIVEEIETDGDVDTTDWPILESAHTALAKARGERP